MAGNSLADGRQHEQRPYDRSPEKTIKTVGLRRGANVPPRPPRSAADATRRGTDRTLVTEPISDDCAVDVRVAHALAA